MARSHPGAAVAFAAVLTAALLAGGSAPAASAVPAPAFARHVLPAYGDSQVVETVAAGDLDGNGRPDILVAGDRYLLRYTSTGARPQLVARGTFGAGAALVVADLDADGRRDIVTSQTLASGQRLEVWFRNTGSRWQRHVLSEDAVCHDLVVTRLAPGTRLAAVCVDQLHHAIVLLRQRAAATAAWSLQTIEAGTTVMGLAVADIDGDGRPDVVAGRTWYRNTGGGWTRHPYTTLASDRYPGFDDFEKLAVLDVNRDGRPDIVSTLFAESPAGVLYAFLAPPDPVTEPWTPVLLDAGPLFGVHSLAVARFDGCPRPELVVADTNIGGWDFGPAPSPHVLLFRRLAGGWSRTVVDSIGAHDVQAADLDGDGRPDLLGHEENTDRAQPPRDGRVFWWRNLGTGAAAACD